MRRFLPFREEMKKWNEFVSYLYIETAFYSIHIFLFSSAFWNSLF